MRDGDAELLRTAYEVWNRRDFARIWELLDPEVVVDARARVMNPDVYTGHEGFQRMVDEMGETWDEWRLEPEEIIDGGDRVVVATRVRARGRASGIELDDLVYNVWTLRDGKALRLALYYDKDDALRDGEDRQDVVTASED
jgi:ketosteroid isomerase-like protein